MTDESGAASTNPPTDAPPHCYRHPNVETYVRCVRCDRPICPQCMHTASVGFQCPECVHQGAKTVRQTRTVFGGLMPQRVGQLTRVLIAVNVAMFLIQQTSNTFTTRFELIGRAFDFRQQAVVGVAEGEYYRLITSAFLHAGWVHIFFNMYALLVVGPTIEAALGRVRFVTLYLMAAFGGSTIAYLLASPTTPIVGASGAIFGLFGALFIAAHRSGAETGGILGIIGINLVLTFVIPNIAWQGHLGGLGTGVALAAAYAYAPRRQQLAVQVAATAVIALVLVAIVVARTHALTH
jgi:membrane associated rhomboid family serine protease